MSWSDLLPSLPPFPFSDPPVILGRKLLGSWIGRGYPIQKPNSQCGLFLLEAVVKFLYFLSIFFLGTVCLTYIFRHGVTYAPLLTYIFNLKN